ncbi:MAG: beta-phosphoglucomutase [Gammaproteobacteria bacterium]|nr:beta-phosphoglucomutase [Gammaproteobacteria bacterium]MBU2056904.1 beta-phosphoglucomutase [Gammaproteobacteria bacterium]MBU2174564.1 beta-phosphoglucomutase [Gammaproteobacteria bacterium]MBU2248256.1 beta-phosphoglucomutase [Gammaproteobacteria bacterium]MBU2343739.1 beta-phosphoglucomutase [Gammaproteobacteria bacterium]
MIQAFIFDLDGVLTDTAEYHFLAWQQLATQLGIDFSREDNELLKGVDRMGSLELILKLGKLQLSQDKKLKLAAQKNVEYLKLVESMSPADLFPGVLPLFSSLKAAGMKTALASASKNAALVLQKLGIPDLFDYVADSNFIQNGKPDPEIFLTCAQALGIAPERCIGVEDAPAGVTAIKAAGMYALGIGEARALAQADLVIPAVSAINQRLLTRLLTL